MSTPSSTLGKFFHGLARLYRGFRAIILNLVFIIIVLLGIGSMLGQPPVVVETGSALLINSEGILVDQLTFVDPLNVLMSDSLGDTTTGEILLRDLLAAIDFAATDSDISSIVLVLNNLGASGLSKLQEVGAALDEFRDSGKKVYAVADNYTQGQYYLATHADEIILNTMGSIGLEGFSTYQYYFRNALDKLGVDVHVFRVGEYKSAVEPFERNDMSAEAREANAKWLGDMWQSYVSDVSAARQFEPEFINAFINTLDQQLGEFNGDFSQLALERNLADQLMSRQEVNDYLRSEIGAASSGNGFLYISLRNYLSSRLDQIKSLQKSNDKIALIVASGQIYDGRRSPGEIGGDSLQDLIRQAREDEDIKAVVLRVDSPGGSAFASEVIRSELARLKNAGKPLVVSMGSVAASGGYWIATAADEIWASESTITGSIGIYGLYPTFKQSFDKLGINTDGIGTTELAGALSVGRELPELASNVIQLNLEDGYNRFIRLVAEARNMTIEEVDDIARGRVWAGQDAFDLGLVDNLGNLDQAIASAATMARLDNFEVQLIEQSLSPGQQLIQDLVNNVTIKTLLGSRIAATPDNPISDFYSSLNRSLQSLLDFNDPQGLYLHCQECLPMLSP